MSNFVKNTFCYSCGQPKKIAKLDDGINNQDCTEEIEKIECSTESDNLNDSKFEIYDRQKLISENTKYQSEEQLQERLRSHIEITKNLCAHEFENKYEIIYSEIFGIPEKNYDNVRCIKCNCTMKKADEDLRFCYSVSKELNENKTIIINYSETHLPHYHIWDNCGNCINKLMFEPKSDGSNIGFEIIGYSLHFNDNSKCKAKRNKIKI